MVDFSAKSQNLTKVVRITCQLKKNGLVVTKCMFKKSAHNYFNRRSNDNL